MTEYVSSKCIGAVALASQAVLENKPPPPGQVGRVSAAEIEALVVVALRSNLSASNGGGGGTEPPAEILTLGPRSMHTSSQPRGSVAEGQTRRSNDVVVYEKTIL